MASAAASVNICAASEISAKLLVKMPPTNSATRKVLVSASAIFNARSFPVAWLWSCPAPMAKAPYVRGADHRGPRRRLHLR
eukprot:45093-Eustigmatos_ZCMA.PRE.1